MIDIYIFVLISFILVLTFFVGRWIEQRHWDKLTQKEQLLSGIMVSDMKSLPPNWKATNAQLVSGQVVLGNDYFRSLCAAWRKIFGGKMIGYERLLSRARREATVRMLQQASQLNANVVWNVRYTTANIGNKDESSSNFFGVEVYAYGTAMTISDVNNSIRSNSVENPSSFETQAQQQTDR
ncbi:MAG: heavy metal-binding domain-containing protein [Planctomycetia bacterium]|nr:heavy metal-binding domain-containing protein [Planctomycetia bacterium]